MSQAASQTGFRWNSLSGWIAGGTLLLLLVAAAVFHRQWLPHVQRLVSFAQPAATDKGHRDEAGGHDPHEGHQHAGHDEANTIELSDQAMKNIGLGVPRLVKRQSFTRTISVPGMIVERPGRSTVEITAPMAGVITRIYAIEGEAVEPGAKLFEVRLTHEDQVTMQAELLKAAEELDVVDREIRRIEDLIKQQALPGRQLLERQYERQKLEASMRAQREALVLHGLTNDQVDAILKDRKLLQYVTVAVSKSAEEGGMSPAGTTFQVRTLKVNPGQYVTAGDMLAVLADHAELFIKGEAFERDLKAISSAAEQGAEISASLDTDGGKPEVISNLRVLYLAATVDPVSRTLDFYVTLPNEKLRDTQPNAHRFITWRFRPGQRVQLDIPVETWPDRIVLPAEAVAQDGVESYVFTPKGNRFVRRSVHVEYRDSTSAVIASDGELVPGDLVMPTGAKQLLLALKNKSGGGVDPHAGHTH
jgi:cobalt-zinc-cadmium efflux system membrane fusion protein